MSRVVQRVVLHADFFSILILIRFFMYIYDFYILFLVPIDYWGLRIYKKILYAIIFIDIKEIGSFS